MDPRYKTLKLLQLYQWLHSKPRSLTLEARYDKNQMLPFMKQVKPKPIPAWLATEFTVVILKPLLFGSHLANIDPHTDDFSCLHANRARGLPVPSCSCVEGWNWGVLDALAPGTSLPVVHSTGMLVTAAHLLQSTAIWTLSSTYKNGQH